MNTNKILAEAIAKEYVEKADSKITALKKLDAKAKRPANIYTFGVFFILVASAGMSLAMQVIGSGTAHMVLGIVLGVIGFAACAFTYPIYKKILEKSKRKYAFEIVELARRVCEES